MQATTWNAIDAHYAEFPGAHSTGIGDSEIQAAATALGVPFPEDYREFLRRYGGGHVGCYAVAGLRRWDFAANSNWSIVDQTMQYRKQKWPGSEKWAIISDDGYGNPIGFDDTGRIWLSDHNCCELVGLELSFEAWVRCHALHLDEPSTDYFTQQKWLSIPPR